ncbi:hypothetical protein N0V93_004082 [Gnomoniopsis smithogilvyi]|uniref:Celp0028 effector like protein n=1 Tax=Gnomoniopsis smithogilvyi TaxID=1191159 RepID=A0A9W8YYC5_9PEZI|nr:hypothetical protein N0V93_004082 [Gnomoniopsis smithogilvyi]
MLFSAFAILAILGASQATPAPKVLEFDDVLLLREDGNHVVMKKWDYQIEEDKREVQRRRLGNKAARTSEGEVAKISKKCEESTEIQVLEDTYFNDWDVAMSPVIGNTGSTIATVAVAKGYSIADAVSVTETVSATLDKVFSASLALSYTNTYTTTDTQTFSFNVPNGQYGLVVSNPWVHRVSGNVLSGCTDSPTVDEFSSSSYTSQNYGDLEWVKGPIVMCNSSTYPVPYCIGQGEHQ